MSDYAESGPVTRGSSRQRQLATGLGYFSVGLGLIELLAPGRLCRALGLEGHETLIRAYGVREIAVGVAILGSQDPGPWLWGRVAGDALDLATLAAAGKQASSGQRGNLVMAAAAVVGVTALDIVCAQGLRAGQSDRGREGDSGDLTGSAAPSAGARAASAAVRDGDPFRPRLRLRIKQSDHSRIVVVDDAEGHEFAYRLDILNDRPTLGSFAPRWANGQEPSASASYLAEARRAAEEEAIDLGWAIG